MRIALMITCLGDVLRPDTGKATGARALVSTDAGCLRNIGGRLHGQQQEIEVLHIAELLERR